MGLMSTHPMVDWKTLGVGCLWLIAAALTFVISVVIGSLALLHFVA